MCWWRTPREQLHMGEAVPLIPAVLPPDDEDVLENAAYYGGLLEGTVDPATIKPRKVRLSTAYEPLVQVLTKASARN